MFGVVRRRRDSCLLSQLSSSVLVEIMKVASLQLRAMKVSNTGDLPTWSTCRDTLCLTPNHFTFVHR